MVAEAQEDGGGVSRQTASTRNEEAMQFRSPYILAPWWRPGQNWESGNIALWGIEGSGPNIPKVLGVFNFVFHL